MRGNLCGAKSRRELLGGIGKYTHLSTFVWHGSCDVARKSAGNKPLISSTSTYPINQSSLNAYCSGISSVIKPKLGDVPINPLVYRNAISTRNNRVETKGEFAGDYILFGCSWKNFDKNYEFEGRKLDGRKVESKDDFKIRKDDFKEEKVEDIKNIVYLM